VPVFRDHPTAVVDVHGTDLRGRPAEVSVRRVGTFTLLLFLSSHCDGCGPLWGALDDPAGSGLEGLDIFGLVREEDRRERAAVRRLVPRGATGRVLVAPQAFVDYRVHGAPFYVLVDGDRSEVAVEGVAWALEQIAADVARARARGMRSA
jgi:hypothetical protein